MVIPTQLSHLSQQMFKHKCAWKAAMPGPSEMWLAISSLKQSLSWDPSQWSPTHREAGLQQWSPSTLLLTSFAIWYRESDRLLIRFGTVTTFMRHSHLFWVNWTLWRNMRQQHVASRMWIHSQLHLKSLMKGVINKYFSLKKNEYKNHWLFPFLDFCL